ncbi:MAG: hypothetical protein L3V56_05750 [Candidatus Magnetoovum sp. WYHC-5]|nr:hypothetical protein [Candidatus Magnetoovum sp. WYHC-5]
MNVDDITDLILLIGTNPLPNYVVAKWFLINPNCSIKRIWLVYSDANKLQAGTKDIAKRLSKILNEEFINVKIKYCPLSNISRNDSIDNDIKKHIVKELKNYNDKNKLHLNYTGGTKTMSVHAYSYLRDACKDNISFSYLDARCFKIIGDSYCDIFDDNDLRNTIKIDIDKLLKLHGYERKPNEENCERWNNALDEFENIISTDKINEYLSWCDEFISVVYYNRKGEFIKEKKKFIEHINANNINAIIDSFNESKCETIRELLQELPKEHSILNEDGSLWIPDNELNNSLFKERLKPVEFLHGKWLECYVQRIILGNEELKEYTIIKPLKFKTSKDKDVDIDIAILCGYQLIGISITTDTKDGTNKLKAFEVLHRVNQIGGEEARAMLISCLPGDHIKAFEEDIKTITGSNKEKFKAIGVSKLQKDSLIKEIKDFVCQV